MLWIAVALPWLPLESVRPSAQPEAPPYALADHARVLQADAAAYGLGVRAGWSRSHALTLAPELVFLSPDPLRESAALEAVALALLAWSPRVVLAPAHTVLLEVSSVLRLFGGLRRVQRQVAQTVATCGHAARLGCAPTPAGAWLLAQAQRRRAYRSRRRVLKLQTLTRVLDRLPIELLPAVQGMSGALEQIGCATFGDLRRLPRGGIARRFGATVLTQLEQAYGEAADPRDAFVAPRTFEARLELMARVDNAQALLFAAARLIAQLCGWLSAQHAALTGFDLLLLHEPSFRGMRCSSRIGITWAEPSRDAQHLVALLREKLNPLRLAAPVLELSLQALRVVAHEGEAPTFFPMPGTERDAVVRLVERLSARLGDERVLELAAHDNHRPEAALRRRAWRLAMLERRVPSSSHPRRRAAGAGRPVATRLQAAASMDVQVARLHANAPERAHFIAPFRTPYKAPRGRFGAPGPLTPNALPRPAWLLDTPQPLSERNGTPFYRSRLTLVAGPERIEAGWWDGEPIARDYYVAADARSHWYWIFRERVTGRWFLHGFFG
ncbi:DNA polymerase Y family protein [Mycetohabitans sp. B8]|uniref:Y-family DNA polymerase n=1 Tax=Mycetohabitans sp. B8 TaxID=2841845 RepID=UPI001F3E6600|nr:DNA polymerase Y family protein [Mycetohabitans sp. B8]MCG1042143.1 DNA polymerase Y family protein [Mycetohabitans sp. B8]